MFTDSLQFPNSRVITVLQIMLAPVITSDTNGAAGLTFSLSVHVNIRRVKCLFAFAVLYLFHCRTPGTVQTRVCCRIFHGTHAARNNVGLA